MRVPTSVNRPRAAAPSFAVRCRIDHTAAGMGALELRECHGVVEAHTVAEVVAVLRDAEAAARGGSYVAGFVSYEAAPAFDPAFRIRSPAQPHQAGASLPLAWFGFFAEASPASPLPPPAPERPDDGTAVPGWTGEIDAPTHGTGVASIHGAIADGDAYLVNYTSRFVRPWLHREDPFDVYCRLVASYGLGYHAFLETDQWAVACGSPELFFEWSCGDIVSRPMKGTAPRGRWSVEDARRAEELGNSPKERAENVMVVDLLRNDLGRVAVPGTVTVPTLWDIEQHPTLWQLSSTVSASAIEGTGLAEVFAALFPCASVTGAPKVSAMSIIADLESSPRGVYCGAVGLLEPPRDTSVHPRARFAVAIRTAVVDKFNGLAQYGSGGGITCDSSARQEWEEVILKAMALAGPCTRALGAEQGLIETMAYEPNARGGDVRNLADHLARLRASASYFGRSLPTDAGARVEKAVEGMDQPARVRLVLRAADRLEVETSPLDHPRTLSPLRLCIDPEPVRSTDVLLFHKTTDRRRYDERTARHPGADDVILVNERGEVTETTRANVAAYVDGVWCTPPLDSGLLPGVGRARALAEGRLAERVITVEELQAAPAVATLSSLRGWRTALVLAACCCPDPEGPAPAPEMTLQPTFRVGRLSAPGTHCTGP